MCSGENKGAPGVEYGVPGTAPTSTLTDSSHESSGGPTTLTQTDAQSAGSNGTIVSGSSNGTLWSNGNDSYSLYQTGQDTYTAATSGSQAGATSLNISSGNTGSGVLTTTSTATNTISSTQTATTTLGSNGAIAGGSSSDYFYETGNDSSTGTSSGSNVRQFVYSGGDSDSSTFTTTFSSSFSSGDTYTLTQTETQSFGANGVISSGQDLTTLTSFGTSTDTYSENGSRTVSWGGSGDYNAGSYSDTETTSQSYYQYESSSLGTGLNGTIAGGIDVSSTTSSMSDSYSNAQNGSELVYDPTGGGLFEPSISQSSFASRYVYSTESGGMTLGSGGTISGGNDSFSFNQSNSDSHTLIAGTSSYNVYETFTDTYTLSMLGTETDGPGGAVTGGSDSYTWVQGADDNTTIIQDDYVTGTMGIYTEDDTSLDDVLAYTFSDVGTDILGASDTILGGCDTYTSVVYRSVETSVVDAGNSGGSPYYLAAFAWDDTTDIDTGSSTLTTNGHLYSTDSFSYVEQSGSTVTTSQSDGSGPDSWEKNGYATDSYLNNENSYSGTASDYSNSSMSMTGSSSVGASGSSFSYSESSSYSEPYNDNGSTTEGTVTEPYTQSADQSGTDCYVVNGPDGGTNYQESTSSETGSGSNPYPVTFPELVNAGHGATAGSYAAEYAGGSPGYTAEHLGTTPGELGGGSLASALGGFAANAATFAGPEVSPNVNSGGSAVNLQESTGPGQTAKNWSPHPSGIGYRRPDPAASGSGSGSGSSIKSNAPITDSGTSDGSSDEELARLSNFDTGGNENASGTQTAPTPRAEQQGSGPMAAGINDSGADANSGGDSEPDEGGDSEDSDPEGDGSAGNGDDDTRDPDYGGDPGDNDPPAAPAPGNPGPKLGGPPPSAVLDGPPDQLSSADPGSGLYDGYWQEVLKALKGEGNAVANMVTGLAGMVLHPIDTVKGVANAVAHPVNTATAMGNAIAQKAESGSEGQGELAGDLILIIAGPSVTARVLSKVKTAARLNKLKAAPAADPPAVGPLAASEAAALEPAAAGEGAVASNAGKPLHVDIGGEGRYPNALNVNPNNVTSTTGAAGRPIPNHVPGTGQKLPFGNGAAEGISLENAPILPETAAEIARVIKPGGSIRLVSPADYAKLAHQRVIEAVGGNVAQVTENGITTTTITVPR